MTIFFISFLSSAIISILLIRYSHLFGHVGDDPADGGPQKFHVSLIPRVGGIAIMAGLLAVVGYMKIALPLTTHTVFFLFILCSIPAFAGGLIEDLTKKVGVKTRLILTMLSAGVGAFLLNALINRLDIPFVDSFLSLQHTKAWQAGHFVSFFFVLAFTMFAVGGIANAVNIIDGFNGIAGMVSLIIISALGYVAYLVGDNSLMSVCVAIGGAIMGFLLWNYPAGMIFLGDGGAYLLGFLIAEVSVLLVNRHPEVSAWFPMMLVAYPVTETFFSIYRRKFLKGVSPGLPDALHLHTLFYRRITRWLIGSKEAKHRLGRNSMTSPYLWAVTVITTLPAITFYRNTIVLICFVTLFIIFYLWLYWRIVRFKSPRWLIIRNRKM